jgi:hypothetical protein
MKIWAKVIKENEKIKVDTVMSFDISLTEKNYESCLYEICRKLDIPTPVTLKYHYKCFRDFNSVKYLPSEFIEKVSFVKLILENCIEK